MSFESTSVSEPSTESTAAIVTEKTINYPIGQEMSQARIHADEYVYSDGTIKIFTGLYGLATTSGLVNNVWLLEGTASGPVNSAGLVNIPNPDGPALVFQINGSGCSVSAATANAGAYQAIDLSGNPTLPANTSLLFNCTTETDRYTLDLKNFSNFVEKDQYFEFAATAPQCRRSRSWQLHLNA